MRILKKIKIKFNILKNVQIKMAVMAMKRNLTERARMKAFESIFTKFDHNQNGKSTL